MFRKNSDGYACFRIPAIIQAKSGTLLAFAEGRKNSCSDSGNIDLVLKRSTDDGKTWSRPIVVWSDGSNTCGNPAPIVDRESGRIVLLMCWNDGSESEREIMEGTTKDTRRIFVTHSDDEGLTWSDPKEITSFVKQKDWTWYATGPCHGIQLQTEKYKGRMVVSANHAKVGSKAYHAQLLYSDDRGENWKLGGVVREAGGNESSVAELSDGTLMLNMRNYNRKEGKCRSYVLSRDGGETVSETDYLSDLIEPICQGSLINYEKDGKPTSCLLFSNPASVEKRERMSVRLSRDDGKTWQECREVYAGPSAYSDLVVLGDGRVGLLYELGEKDAYERIGFTLLPREE